MAGNKNMAPSCRFAYGIAPKHNNTDAGIIVGSEEDGDMLMPSGITREEAMELIDTDDMPDEDKVPPLSGTRLEYVQKVIQRVKNAMGRQGDAGKGLAITTDGWIYPTSPLFDSEPRFKPDRFYNPKVYFWLPRGFKKIVLYCPNCSSSDTSANGWPDKPIARRVIGLKECYFLVGRRQKCNTCKKQFNSYDPQVLARLPPRIRLLFPAFLTARSGIDRDLLGILCDAVSQSFGFQAFREMIYEFHTRMHQERTIMYYDLQNSMKNAHIFATAAIQFPDFESADYGGFVPSSRYLADVYIAYMEQYEPFMLAQMAKVSAEKLSSDHTHKVGTSTMMN